MAYHVSFYYICETLIDLLFFYLLQVKTLIQELECLVKDVYGITLTASLNALEVSESSSVDNYLKNESCFQEVKSLFPVLTFLLHLLALIT